MNGVMQILLVEDNPDDRALVIRELGREFPAREFTFATNFKELNLALQRGPWDLVVTDHQLRWSDGFTVLSAVKARWPDCPVIMFTGSGNEEIAVQAMKAGLDDYVLKSPRHYARLAAAAHLALERVKQRRRLRDLETRYQTLFNRVPVGLFCVALDGRIMEANPALIQMLGVPDRRTLFESNARTFFANTRQRRAWLRAIHRSAVVERFELQLRRQDSKLIWVEINARAVNDDYGRIQYCEGSAENITVRKRAEAQIRDSREQLRALAAHLQSAREEERTRLAREVQNELGQELAGLKMHLALVRETVGEAADATSRASTREQLKSLPDVVDRLIGTVRKIGAQLRPSVLDDLGLEAAIGCEVKEFVKRTGIKCKFNSAVRNAKLDPKRATEIFRLFQETLTNVVGQTKATEATIQLREERDKLVLEIEDNGKDLTGREISAMRSLDLLGMRERVTTLDGKINVVSRQGKGTFVGVRIPLRHQVNPATLTGTPFHPDVA